MNDTSTAPGTSSASNEPREVKGRVLPLVPSDDPILTTPTVPVDFDDTEIDTVQLAYDLVATMDSRNALGISANQVGLPHRVFAMRSNPNYVCFNPRIVSQSDEENELDEGCLSFPNLIYKARRPKEIRVRFQTPNGQVTTQTFRGMSAAVFCHEMMHLDGRLPFEGIGRLRIERSLKFAEKKGSYYRNMGVVKAAVTNIR